MVTRLSYGYHLATSAIAIMYLRNTLAIKSKEITTCNLKENTIVAIETLEQDSPCIECETRSETRVQKVNIHVSSIYLLAITCTI